MDRQTSKSSRSQRILALVSELGIVDCKNKRISILSGGERKRLSVAVQVKVFFKTIGENEPGLELIVDEGIQIRF